MMLYFFVLFTCLFFPCFSEIEKAILSWDPNTCIESCVLKLERKFQTSMDIAEFKIPTKSNQAIIRWRPNRLFNISMLNKLSQGTGVNFKEIQVTVRGTLRHDIKGVSIISIGDNTVFNLFSPSPETAEKEEKRKPILTLLDETRNQLITAENEHKIIKVEGYLSLDGSTSPLKLIATKIIIPPPIQ